MAIRVGLLKEVVAMAFDTVRTNKMRSGLTVLGVVIGITSIVGMTSMIRGFDESLRDSIRSIGPNLITIQRAGPLSFANGVEFAEILRRPNLTISDARAIEQQAPSVHAGRCPAGGARPGAPDAGAGLLSRPANAQHHHLRHDRELRDGLAAGAGGRPLLHRHGGPAST